MRRTNPLIVGGGPAGAAAAMHLLDAGIKPIVVERQAAGRDALCGGFLSWRTVEMLETLGISRDLLKGHDVNGIRIFSGGHCHELPLPMPAIALSRQRLDLLLLTEAERRGAVVRRGVAAQAFVKGHIQLDSGELLTGDGLFLATGKHDLRGLPRPKDAVGEDPMLGLRLRMTPSDRLMQRLGSYIEMHLFKGGYLGVVLQENESANFCMAVRKSRLAAAKGSPAILFAQLADENPALGERLSALTATQHVDAIGRVPYGWRATGTQPGVFRLGDQAGVIPSLAGEGIGIALASAQCAIRHWREGGSAAAPAYQHAFARQMRRPIAVAELVSGLARHPVSTTLALSLIARFPGALRLIAGATRI